MEHGLHEQVHLSCLVPPPTPLKRGLMPRSLASIVQDDQAERPNKGTESTPTHLMFLMRNIQVNPPGNNTSGTWFIFSGKVVASLLLVAMPGAPNVASLLLAVWLQFGLHKRSNLTWNFGLPRPS